MEMISLNTPIKKTLTSLFFIVTLSISSQSCAKNEDSNASKKVNDHANTTTESVSQSVIEHGEQVHKAHCYKCHTDEVYTREDRLVKSLDALSKQVNRCTTSTNVPWFDEDADAVAQFLNEKYYRF